MRSGQVRILICLAVLITRAGAGFCDGPLGRVIERSGLVEVRGTGEETWRELPVRASVYLHDTVRTGANGRVMIALADESEITLGTDTVFSLESFAMSSAQNFRESVIRVFLGRLRFHLRRQFAAPSSFEIHTPTAIAGAKGTSGVVLVPSPQVTLLFVESGEMILQNADPAVPGTVTVMKGYTSSVDEGAPPGDPEPAIEDPLPPPPVTGALPPAEDEPPAVPGSGEAFAPGFVADIIDQPADDIVNPLPAPPAPPGSE